MVLIVVPPLFVLSVQVALEVSTVTCQLGQRNTVRRDIPVVRVTGVQPAGAAVKTEKIWLPSWQNSASPPVNEGFAHLRTGPVKVVVMTSPSLIATNRALATPGSVSTNPPFEPSS